MARNQKEVYCFLSNNRRKFYKAEQASDGTYAISFDSSPYPIKFNPSNLLEVPLEFGTNSEYFSVARSITYQFDFVKDGAAIIRDRYYTGKGGEEDMYLTVIQWNGLRNLYELGYYGKLVLPQKLDRPESETITVPTLDDSAWGMLNDNDGVEYAIDCTSRNPKAIPVLFDSITLVNKYTYQTVQAPIQQPISSALVAGIAIPFVLVNQDGDSAGVVVKDQTGYEIHYPIPGSPNFDALKTDASWFFSTAYPIIGMRIQGSWDFQYNNNAPLLTGSGITLSLRTSFGRRFPLYSRPYGSGLLVDGKRYSVPIDFTLDLGVSESLFLIIEFGNAPGGGSHVTITPITSNIFINTVTKAQPQISYGLRPLDLAQQLMAKVTRGRFTIGSSFFVENNKDILFGGESLRNIANAKIYTSFKDFFDSFNFIYFLAMQNISGSLLIEKAINVYKLNLAPLINLGNAISLEVESAVEYQCNEVEQGSPSVDLRHPSGRLEFNGPAKWSFPIMNSGKKKQLVTKYRTGCYDIQFLILDYQNSSTVDNSGDKTVYIARITDEQGYASDDIETFENINIDNAILEPLIKSPLDNDVITFNLPTVKGIATPNTIINIYADGALDGVATSDSSGDWTYNLVNTLTAYALGTEDGVHIIEASFSDLAAPKSTITITIDTAIPSLIDILYPKNGENLFNNKPLIKGVAQTGAVIDISLDGTLIGTVVADGSCKWEFKSPVMSNGTHSITVNAAIDTVTFKVDTRVAFPIITYVGSELDGFPIINNLPLIEGVALPGTVVTIWLNYENHAALGSAIANVNGNWSYQVIPITYTDFNGVPIVLAPIRNGLSIISTMLQNQIVKIVVSGYLLSRPLYSPITGVTDNSVFNTELSPARMFRNWSPMWASVLRQQPNEKVYFQKPDKNGQLATTLNGVTIIENADIPVVSMGAPLMLLEIVRIKVNASKTFAETLYNFNNGGEIQFTYRGYTLYALPIGKMKLQTIRSSTQEWSLVLSPKTPLLTLLNLYKNGTTINIMKNAIYHSNYNTLHVVTYNFAPNPKYNARELYDDWFEYRNDAWIDNPIHIQKVQRTDPIIDQIVSNGVYNLTLKMYRCSDVFLIDSKTYIPITPAIELPDVVLEARYVMTDYPADQYFFVIHTDNLAIGITERIHTRDVWEGTIYIESTNSKNKVGAFFYTGFQGTIRVDGLVKKRQPYIDMTDTAEFENGDAKLLYAKSSIRRIIRFGTAYGLPDYQYLKIADYIALDGFKVQGILYALPDGEKIQPADEYDGHPMYYYNVLLEMQTVETGSGLAGDPNAELNSVVLVVDGLSVGLPAGSLINIQLNG